MSSTDEKARKAEEFFENWRKERAEQIQKERPQQVQKNGPRSPAPSIVHAKVDGLRALNPRRHCATGRSSRPIHGAQVSNNEGDNDTEENNEKEYSLLSIDSHGASDEPHLFELQVREGFTDGTARTRWLREDEFHGDAREMLLEYWRDVGGREAHMEDSRMWYMQEVTGHRVSNGCPELCVLWVGSDETTWEAEGKVRNTAPKLLQEYYGGLERVRDKGRKMRRSGQRDPSGTKRVCKRSGRRRGRVHKRQ